MGHRAELWDLSDRPWREFYRRGGLQAALAQAIEGLRRSDFMHEVQVNVKDGGSIGLFSDNVRVPDFLE